MNEGQFVRASMELSVSVAKFHKRFDTEPDTEGFHDLGLLTEELGEFARAANTENRPEALAELADLVYVGLGALCLAGKPGSDALIEVANKNNRKTLETHYRHPETRKITRRQ